MASNPNSSQGSVDRVQRGNYTLSRAGTVTWIGLRAVDPVIQYQLLFRGWGQVLLSQVGVPSIALNASSSALRFLPLAMSVGAVTKHVYWILGVNREYFGPSFAIKVAAFNLLFDTTASLLLLSSKTSAAVLRPQLCIPGTSLSLSIPMIVGTVMFTIGLTVETLAEIQRKWFKEKPENKGKVYTGGLWQLVRHINYGAYTLWRGGYMLTAGSWTPAAVLVGFLLQDFYNNSIRGMDHYMSDRYGEQWTRYKANVPYRLFPGIL
ncbi:hypothetical protein F5884DRAFT_806361 [Xylogone sp. PMI_703]|nr:hypothetical protein F5884DRAFT_806361 [Xylogone sp. PMI_703]